MTGLKERLNREIMEIRPFQTVFNVVIADNVNISAWHGAKEFANLSNFNEYLTTKNDYMEYGGEYFKEHYASNKYFSTPVVLNEPGQTSMDVDVANNGNAEKNDSPIMNVEKEIYVE